jgi:mono/diheme cytochrome c family protein
MRGKSFSRGPSLARQRRWFGGALLVTVWVVILWFFAPGIPVLWGPSASAAVKEAGRELFEHDWQPHDPLAHGDGLGPVFNATSCVACHSQGGVGGGGDFAHNIRNFEVLPNRRDTRLVTGTVHFFATEAGHRESLNLLRQRFPVVKGQTIPPPPQAEGHCGYSAGPTVIPDFDPVRTQDIQPTALFGAGWIDRISSRSITHSQLSQSLATVAKEFQLDFGSVPTGRVRVLADGRIGKFGWKAQFATLEEFVAAACANELGLGTPRTEQVKPLGRPNYPVAAPDLDITQFRALVAFVDTLPRPVEALPDAPAQRAAAVHGKDLFSSIGCAACHVPDIGGVKGVYSDLLLHSIDDKTASGGGSGGYGVELPPDATLPPDLPKPDEWRTPPLWGVADSAPYLHDGSARTLRDAILRHGGDAKAVREAYKRLSHTDQEALVAFLRTLRAPPDALPPNKTMLAANAKP